MISKLTKIYANENEKDIPQIDQLADTGHGSPGKTAQPADAAGRKYTG